jgi:hypothetical protein
VITCHSFPNVMLIQLMKRGWVKRDRERIDTSMRRYVNTSGIESSERMKKVYRAGDASAAIPAALWTG